MATHHPSSLTLHQKSRMLEISFNDGARFQLPCEYLRVYSPSAEVRGHVGNRFNLVPGKEEVNIKQMIPIGQYAIKIVFDDGHRSGLYDWDYLYKLGQSHAELWDAYLKRCHESGYQRLEGL